jgi:hypothetical protein
MSENISIKPIKCYCHVVGTQTQIEFQYEPEKYYNSLIDYVKFILKQVIYMDYLNETLSSQNGLNPPVLEQLITTLRNDIAQLPKPNNAVLTGRLPKELLALYSDYYNHITVTRYTNTLIDLLLAPNLDPNSPNTECSEEELKFLLPFIHTRCKSCSSILKYCMIDETTNESCIPSPTILIPDIVYHNHVITIQLSPVVLSTIYRVVSDPNNRYSGVLGMLYNMDLTSYTADDILTLYDSIDICNKSLICDTAQKIRIKNITTFVLDLYQKNKLKEDINQPLLAKYVNIAGIESNTLHLEILTLPKSKWTDEHIRSFKYSPLYSSLHTSLVKAMEANTEDDIPTDDLHKDTQDDSDNASDDDRLDQVMQLLELAKQDEKFSDYVYRKLLAERMIRIVKNPPQQMSKAQVSILKSWLTHWIHLVSIKSLKSFISKFQFDFIGIKTYKLVNATNK